MRRTIISIVAAGMLLTSGLYASQTSAQVSQKAVQSAKSEAHQQQLSVVEEAVDAVMLTQSVLAKLDKKDVTGAKKDLEKAIGKLEVVLAHKDAPALLQIDSAITAT